jgi:hypothetical protein
MQSGTQQENVAFATYALPRGNCWSRELATVMNATTVSSTTPCQQKHLDSPRCYRWNLKPRIWLSAETADYASTPA